MRFPILLTLLAALPCIAEVNLEKHTEKIDVSIDGKPFTTLYFGQETRKPYLHPIRSASGKQVTRSYPMEQVAGETNDHPHHRGLWFTHGDVNGIDFWASEADGEKKGKVVLDRIKTVKSGNPAKITGVWRWIGPAGEPLLTETRTMLFSGDGTDRQIDFDIVLKAEKPVKFGDTKEGTFAIRLADVLSEKRTGAMRNAAGASGMKNVWGKPSPWVDYSGNLDGETLGIAIFDHPANPRHPSHWHSRDYGLFAANIFGEHDFYADKARDGSLSLEAGKSVRFRYRVIVHPDDAAAAGLAEKYSAYK